MTTGPEPQKRGADQPVSEAETADSGPLSADEGAIVSDELEELVGDLTRERDQYLELAQRAKADFENYRKRSLREAGEAERRGKARAGVESYDPTGERFDPAVHEAISTKPAEDGGDSGMVVETLERGYRLDGQVLRPARVVVSE